jgi:hypothetical protein
LTAPRQVCDTIRLIAARIKGKKIEELFENMGATWNYLVSDPQMRWIGPEKMSRPRLPRRLRAAAVAPQKTRQR